MSDVRIYVDEDAGEHAVMHGLRARGVELLTTLEANQLGAADEAQLAFAIGLQRTLYTLNVADYARLHREYLEAGMDHTGIIVIPDQRYSTGEKIRRLAKFVRSISNDEMVNRMEYL